MKGTIRSSEEISALFAAARRVSTANLLVLIAPTTNGRGQQGRVAFIAGKRLGTAPFRNRAKRLMREAARRAGIPREGLDIALVARESTARQHPEELAYQLTKALRRPKHDRQKCD